MTRECRAGVTLRRTRVLPSGGDLGLEQIIESLELLEAALQDYSGTLLLVSHDRAFLDNVVRAGDRPGRIRG